MEDGLGLGSEEGDVHVSYLPLAHIYERTIVYTCLHNGAGVRGARRAACTSHGMSLLLTPTLRQIGFYRGDVLGLLDDMAALQPTLFVSVPRLLNRIYDKVLAGVNQGSVVQRTLFHMAYAHKKRAMQEGRPVSPFWDKLVFSKLRLKLGGRVRVMSTGSAPISGEVLEFLRVCFGGIVFEGYGMTESACVISKTDPEDFSTGHVGPPVGCCEIKLVDVPEMQYLTSDRPTPRGEICVRGPSVFQGYYKEPQQTAEVLDADGWLHTGDIGTWLPGGRLKIIDRKKNIFKLAQGEYVAPEKIENVYVRAPLVAACFIHGDSLSPYLVSIVVPDEEVLQSWARAQHHPSAGNTRALCADPKVVATVMAQMKDVAAKAGLRSFEQAKALYLHPEVWTVESGLITPSFKLKRPQARAYFKEQIDTMYKKLVAAQPAE
jgi:long-chain acyl-CoA synthetase